MILYDIDMKIYAINSATAVVVEYAPRAHNFNAAREVHKAEEALQPAPARVSTGMRGAAQP